jgi:hypothetical protein
MKTKATYRIRNWTDYNRSLEKRGSLTIWISDGAVQNWLLPEKTGNRGASRRYSDLAIQTMAIMKAVFHQAGRQVVGLVKSLFELMEIKLPVPDHSTLSRRLETVEVGLLVKSTAKARHIVEDSTGVKVYGARRHGKCEHTECQSEESGANCIYALMRRRMKSSLPQPLRTQSQIARYFLT